MISILVTAILEYCSSLFLMKILVFQLDAFGGGSD